jgi:hypothetical protein
MPAPPIIVAPWPIIVPFADPAGVAERAHFMTCQRAPPGVRDPQCGDLHPFPPPRGCAAAWRGEPGADKLDQLLDCEAVREHHRFGAALLWAVG